MSLPLSHLHHLAQLLSLLKQRLLSSQLLFLQKQHTISHCPLLQLHPPPLFTSLLKLMPNPNKFFIKSRQILLLLFLLHNKNINSQITTFNHPSPKKGHYKAESKNLKKNSLALSWLLFHQRLWTRSLTTLLGLVTLRMLLLYVNTQRSLGAVLMAASRLRTNIFLMNFVSHAPIFLLPELRTLRPDDVPEVFSPLLNTISLTNS